MPQAVLRKNLRKSRPNLTHMDMPAVEVALLTANTIKLTRQLPYHWHQLRYAPSTPSIVEAPTPTHQHVWLSQLPRKQQASAASMVCVLATACNFIFLS